MARNPGFTAVAVLTLALGIGANTAIFGLLNKIVLRLLPVRNPEELRMVEVARSGSHGALGKADASHTYPQYVLWRDRNRSFTALAAANSGMKWRDQSAAGDKSWHLGQFVSGNYFDVLGVAAAIGRVLAPADDSIENAGGPAGAVAVLSDRYWRAAFDANPSAFGRQINVNGAWVTVVGVTPPGFFGMQVGSAPQIFVPIHLQPVIMPDPGSWLHDPPRGSTTWVRVFGRLRPGLSETQAKADLTAIYTEYEVSRMSATDRAAYFVAKTHALPGTVLLTPGGRGFSELRDHFSDPLKVLMAMVGIVLLIACANLANLLLARGNTRGREIAIRLAIGAARGRIVRQFLTESGMLAFAGGALGLLFAFWSGRVLMGTLPQALSQPQASIGLDVTPDGRILAVTFGVSLVSALLFGLTPALFATRHGVSAFIRIRSNT
jgi:predicted permease